jgi:hypothetical protein
MHQILNFAQLRRKQIRQIRQTRKTFWFASTAQPRRSRRSSAKFLVGGSGFGSPCLNICIQDAYLQRPSERLIASQPFMRRKPAPTLTVPGFLPRLPASVLHPSADLPTRP